MSTHLQESQPGPSLRAAPADFGPLSPTPTSAQANSWNTSLNCISPISSWFSTCFLTDVHTRPMKSAPDQSAPSSLSPQPSSSSSLQHIKEQEQYAAIKHVVCLNACFMNQAKITKQVSIYISLQFLDHDKTTPASPLPSHLVSAWCHPLAWDVVRKEGPREHLPGLMLDHTSTMPTEPKPQTSRHMLLPPEAKDMRFPVPSRVLVHRSSQLSPKKRTSRKESHHQRCSALTEEVRGRSQRSSPCSAACPLQGWLTDPEFQQLVVIHMSERAQGPCRGTWRGATSTQSSWSSNCPFSLSTRGRSRLSSEPSLACYKLQQKIKRHSRGREKYAYYLK